MVLPRFAIIASITALAVPAGVAAPSSASAPGSSDARELKALMPIWHQESPATAPPQSASYEMVFDSTRDHVVMWGGSLGDQVWTWDGSTWTSTQTSGSPSMRRRHSMAYDPILDEIVLFGGFAEDTESDTWILKNDRWSEANPRIYPPNRQGAAMAFDPNRQQVVMFGGVDADGGTSTYLDDMWAWDGKDWTELTSDTAPSPRAVAAFAYDPSRDALVLFGGSAGDAGIYNDTWTWNGTTWTQEFPQKSPSLRGSAASSTFGQHVIVFSGSVNRTGYPAGDRSWVLKKKSWRVFGTSPAPEGRWDSAFAWDRSRDVGVLFGGTTGPSNFLGDTWTVEKSRVTPTSG